MTMSGKMWGWLLLTFAGLGKVQPTEHTVVNTTITDNLYHYLFRRPQSVSLPVFPYCYDSVDDSTHRLLSRTCQTAENGTSFCYASGNNGTLAHSALDVFVEVSVNQVLEVNERLRWMRLKMTVFLMWIDCRLEWSTEQFALRELHVSIEQFRALGVYIPILALHEEVTPEASKSAERWISIFSSGTVYLERMYTTELSCAFDISMYPFDTQTCNITFESVLEKPMVSLVNTESPDAFVTSDRMPLYLSLQHLGVGRFIPSDTWEVIVLAGEYGTRNICATFDIVVHVDKCLYDFVVHKMVLRRHPAYQLINLLLPAFLIVTISSCVFLLPPGTGDKTNLSITILLSLFIFMQIMYYKMPESGETLPLLTQYYIFCVGLIVLSCIAGTFSAILDSSALPIPQRLRNFVHLFGSRLARDRLTAELRRSSAKSNDETYGDVNNENALKSVFQRASGRRCKKPDVYEWHDVATVFDRTIFILHLLSTVGVLAGYLIWGYVSYRNYGYLLDDEGWTLRDIQMGMVNDDYR